MRQKSVLLNKSSALSSPPHAEPDVCSLGNALRPPHKQDARSPLQFPRIPEALKHSASSRSHSRVRCALELHRGIKLERHPDVLLQRDDTAAFDFSRLVQEILRSELEAELVRRIERVHEVQ
jgi:hypothetical protein